MNIHMTIIDLHAFTVQCTYIHIHKTHQYRGLLIIMMIYLYEAHYHVLTTTIVSAMGGWYCQIVKEREWTRAACAKENVPKEKKGQTFWILVSFQLVHRPLASTHHRIVPVLYAYVYTQVKVKFYTKFLLVILLIHT